MDFEWKKYNDSDNRGLTAEAAFYSTAGDYTLLKDKNYFKYTVNDVLGSGEFGFAFKVKKDDGTAYALKLVFGNINSRDMKREIQILSSIKHQNIVTFIEHAKITPKSSLVNIKTEIPSIAIVMELCDGNLHIKLEKREEVENEWNKSIFLQILNALGYIHSQGIVHRDLKPENILYNLENGQSVVKIADFGLSKICTLRPTIPSRSVGTYRYMAPELQFGYVCNYRSDIFSLGIILMEMYTLESVESWIVPFRRRNLSKLIEVNINRDILRLALNMTNEDPEERPQSCERLKELFTLIAP